MHRSTCLAAFWLMLFSASSSLAKEIGSFERANLLLLAGKYEEALTLYDHVRSQQGAPRAVDAEYLAARSLLHLDATREARSRLEAFVGQHRGSPWADDALMDLARLDATDDIDQNLQAAIARYEYLIENYPDSIRLQEALREIGRLYVQVEQWKEAETTFYSLLSSAETDEQVVHARLRIAAIFSADGNPGRDLPRALDEYENEILAKYPKTRQRPTVYFAYGEVRRKLGLFGEAIDSYRVILQKWPRHSLVPLVRSLVEYCQEQKNLQAAAARPAEGVLKKFGDEAGLSTVATTASLGSTEGKQIQVLSNRTESDKSGLITLFSENVQVFYGEFRIDAQRARYDSRRRTFDIEGPAKIQTRSCVIHTDSPLQLNLARQIMEIHGRVREVMPDGKERILDGELVELHLPTGKLSRIR